MEEERALIQRKAKRLACGIIIICYFQVHRGEEGGDGEGGVKRKEQGPFIVAVGFMRHAVRMVYCDTRCNYCVYVYIWYTTLYTCAKRTKIRPHR